MSDTQLEGTTVASAAELSSPEQGEPSLASPPNSTTAAASFVDGSRQPQDGDEDEDEKEDVEERVEVRPTEEELVPIMLTYEMNGLLITDVLVWNLLDPLVTPEYFAENLCEDLGLSDLQMQQIVSSIREQIDVHINNLANIEAVSWQQRRQQKKRKIVDSDARPYNQQQDRSNECMVTIKIDLVLHGLRFKDQFQWDALEPNNDPEAFARGVVMDMGLPAYFTTPIAYSIRQQVLVAKMKHFSSLQKMQHLAKKAKRGFVSVPVAQQLMQERVAPGIRQALSDMDLKRWGPRLVRSNSATVPVAGNPVFGSSAAAESSYTTRSRRRQGEKLFPSDCDGIPYYGITDDSDEEDDGFGAIDNMLLTPQPGKPKELSLSYLATLNRPRSHNGRFLSKEELIKLGAWKTTTDSGGDTIGIATTTAEHKVGD